MREDFPKVIIEKPRTGGHGARRNRKNDYIKDYREDREVSEPSRQGISIWAGWNTKSLSDNLGPLRGFLHKRVGQPWDKVWSEVCRSCRGFMGEHLKGHLLQLVVLKVTVDEDGTVRDTQGGVLDGRYGFWKCFYVDDCGILREAPKSSRYRRTKKKSRIVMMNGQEYYCHNGVWFRVKTEKYTKEDVPFSERMRNSSKYLHVRYGVVDVFGNLPGFYNSASSVRFALEKVYGASVYCTWKQQANSKESKKLNKLASGIV